VKTNTTDPIKSFSTWSGRADLARTVRWSAAYQACRLSLRFYGLKSEATIPSIRCSAPLAKQYLFNCVSWELKGREKTSASGFNSDRFNFYGSSSHLPCDIHKMNPMESLLYCCAINLLQEGRGKAPIKMLGARRYHLSPIVASLSHDFILEIASSRLS